MKVELLNTTPDALAILIYTKDTRLQGERTFQEVKDMPEDWKMEQLEYMRHTIQGAFEFVDYTFRITEVSRALTHQLVRTRDASFQQESLRAVDVRKTGWTTPEPGAYGDTILAALEDYGVLIDQGMPIQDARGVLPMAIHTGIIMKANLRTLSRMAEHRLCTRTQGEYQNLFKELKAKVVEVHPWAEPSINAYCVRYGICCFPNYDKCPIQRHTMKYTDVRRSVITTAWKNTNHESNPVAKNGSTM